MTKPKQRCTASSLGRTAVLRWIIFAAVVLLPPAARPSPPPGTATPAETSLEADASLEASGAVVGDISVVVEDIFDSDDLRLLRWANHLHRSTRQSVILQQLVITPGDRYESRLLRESERILRANGYLRDVHIHPVRRRDDLVDLEVDVRDGWTLGGGFSYGRGGGVSSTTVSVQDSNFLGTGMGVAIKHSTTVDRTSNLLRFNDDSLGRHHLHLLTIYSDNSDGSDMSVDFGRSFYSLDSRWAAGLAALESERIDSRYDLGEIVDRFRHQERQVDLFGGLSPGLRGTSTHRWTFGLTLQEDRFGTAAGFDPAELQPDDRTFVYPWVGFEQVQDAYLEAVKIDEMDRIEDRYVGRRFTFRLGPAVRGLGSDSDRFLFQGELGIGRQVSPKRLFAVSAAARGRWGGGGLEDFQVGGSATYHWRDFGRHLLFVALSGDMAVNLDRDHQLTLGGDSGLRGFPLRYQDGDRRFLATLEQRFFTNKQILRLVEVGFAVFVDVGRSWFSGVTGGGDPGRGVLADAGVGLRFAMTRAGKGTIIHVDFAFPYGGDPSISPFQVLVSSKKAF